MLPVRKDRSVAFAAKHAVRRSLRGSGHLGGAAGSHFTANAGTSDDLACELVPRAVAAAGYVDDSDRPRRPGGQIHHGRRQMAGERRAAHLVVDDHELVALAREPEDGRRKAGTEGAEQPGRAHDRVAAGRLHSHLALPGELRTAVRRHRPDNIGFDVWRMLGPVEYV